MGSLTRLNSKVALLKFQKSKSNAKISAGSALRLADGILGPSAFWERKRFKWVNERIIHGSVNEQCALMRVKL
ncbi:hypothetical protein CEXT_542361 [Caerostris extrusa]|uniref:Uncharacterized protein n=1 Tax=Caerostris extrusa TaxID=172846 RepID=A0AAV4NDJ6_CAEEX|nr:hypothetical protein CEXT_542361 [Caerostris extrusa]